MKTLIGNLNLNHDVNEGQALYHSQLYGTFFGVYAFIESKDAGDKKIITSMKLQVINYKGVLNLGIEEAKYNKSTGHIELIMRAMSDKTENIPVTDIDKLSVSNGQRIIVTRYLKPLHSDHSSDNIPLQKGVFDSEFHYREGIIVNQETLKADSSRNNITGKPVEPKQKFHTAQAAGGWFCPYAELVLLWL